jgi:hypothetical protein
MMIVNVLIPSLATNGKSREALCHHAPGLFNDVADSNENWAGHSHWKSVCEGRVIRGTEFNIPDSVVQIVPGRFHHQGYGKTV